MTTDAKKPEAQNGTESQQQAQQQQPAAENLLEADDLFEEFGNEEWAAMKNGEAAALWEADWADENTADDFTARLRSELERGKMKE